MAEVRRTDRVPVMVRMSAAGLVGIDGAASLLGVTRADVIRRAVRYGLPKVQAEAAFAAEAEEPSL